jgi:hypothetical protein
LAAILKLVASSKLPWMQISSLSTNSSLQNTRYQFSLKSEIINWYLGLFWSEELVGIDEICIQGHFYEATIFKMAANKIVELSMVSDFNENWYLRLFWSEELIGNPWMQISSLPTNSSIQNTPIYQFSLKSETIDNLTKNDPECKFHHYQFSKWLLAKSSNRQWSPISMKIDI